MEFYSLAYKEMAYYKKNIKGVIFNCIVVTAFATVFFAISNGVTDDVIRKLLINAGTYFMPLSIIMGNISSSIMFEEFDNMTDFLFSNNMKKSNWLIVKIFFSVTYGMIISLIPYLLNVVFLNNTVDNILNTQYNVISMGMIIALVAIFIRIQPFTILTIVFQFVGWIIIICLINITNSRYSYIIYCSSIVILYLCNLLLLKKKETRINIGVSER